MKKKILILSLCLLLGLAACGCGQKKTEVGSGAEEAARAALIGTWTQVTDDGSPSLPELGIPSGYVFYENGDGTDLFWDMPFTYTVEDGVIHISYNDSLGEDADYLYVFEGETLALTRADDPEAITMLYQQKAEEEETE